MSGSEVTRAPDGLLMVKEERPGDTHDTRVILHLQPILQGVNEDTAETGTTVLAIETHHEDTSTEGEEVEYGYPITCGDSRAVLLFKKFVCPGINVRCVKFNDQLISPKQFVHLAGKATLKDWKRAIRLGGVMLRKMMDSGQIDFYQHDTVCTNTCRSTKFDLLINSTRLPPGPLLQPAPCPSPLTVHPGDGGLPVETDEGPEERANSVAEWSPGPAPPNNYTTANGHVKRKRTHVPDGALSFWKGVADLGLMGAVLSSIRTELLGALQGVEVRSDEDSLLEADGQMLNSLCEMFGLLHSVRRALDLRLSRTEQNQVHNTPYDLEDQLDPGPGLAYESSSFTAASSSKRPRLHQTSTASTAAGHTAALSPVTTLPAGQVLSVAGLPVAALAQLPTGSQLLARVSAPPPGGRAGLELPIPPSHGKEQREPAMEHAPQTRRRTEFSHFRREEEEEEEEEEGEEEEGREGEVQRTGSRDDVEILVVGEGTLKKRKIK